LGSLKPNKRTVTFDHEWFDNIVSNQLKVGMADPVGDACLGTGEKVIEHGDLMAEKHEAVNQMRADEACATCYEDALTARLGEKLDWGETAEGGVGDGLRLRVVDRL
jgi:hypothetical protein